MKVRKVLVIAMSLVGLGIFSTANAERIGPNEKCAYSWAACQSNSTKCSDPKKCQARCDEKNRQCLVSAGSRGGNRTTNAGGATGTGVGAGNTKNIPGTKTGANTNAGAATGSTIGASGAKSAPTQQMPTSTNPVAGSGGGAGQPSRSRRM